MPFTFAHPAAVLPLSRWCPRLLNLPALIVGSMVPDLGYYVHNWVWSIKGHSFAGIITFDVPAGLLLLWAFYLSARPVAELLGSPHKEILLAYRLQVVAPGWRNCAVTVLSLVAGACTHIVWDGFTHANGWCVNKFSALTPTVFSIGSYHVSVWQLLQHASTAIGLYVLLHFYRSYAAKFPVVCRRPSPAARAFLLASVILPACLAAMSSFWAFAGGPSIPNFDVFAFNFVVTFVGLFFPALIVAGFLLLFVRAISRRLQPEPAVADIASDPGEQQESKAA